MEKMNKFVAATQNKHKIQEIEKITSQFGIEIVSKREVGLGEIDIEEDGSTFEENSYKKGYEIMRLTNMPAIADDSGLVVDELDGAPGIYSARFAGEESDDKANTHKLLLMMEGKPMEKRTARFVSVITVVYPNEEKIVCRGECEGHILFEEHGEKGFGYDPVFRPLGYDISFAEMSPDEKNEISHRAKALKKLWRELQKIND